MNNIATTIANHSTSKEALDQARQWENQGLGQIERALKEIGPVGARSENEQDTKTRAAARCYAHMVSALLNLAAIERVRTFCLSPLCKLRSSDCSCDSLTGTQRWRERIFKRHWTRLHRKGSRLASWRPKSTWRIWMLIDRFPSSKLCVSRAHWYLYGGRYTLTIAFYPLLEGGLSLCQPARHSRRDPGCRAGGHGYDGSLGWELYTSTHYASVHVTGSSSSFLVHTTLSHSALY